MSEPIVVREYDPSWPTRYEALRGPIAAAVGNLARDIQHVGSTSVAGLAAKPTIDIVILLGAVGDLPLAIERLAQLGYVHEGDFGIAGREAFATPPGYAPHDHHLYLCHPDWLGYRDQIVFRDWLRAHSDAAEAYARLKRRLAVEFRENRTAYTDAKASFVAEVLARARSV